MLIILLAICAVFAACKKAWRWSGVLLTTCILLNWYSQTFAFNPFEKLLRPECKGDVLRVMTYNIGADGDYILSQKDGDYAELLKSIGNCDVDVLAITELSNYTNWFLLDLLISLFPYSSFNFVVGRNYNTTHIFSKYPILNSNKIRVNQGGEDILKENLLIDIETSIGIVKFVACHLCSNNYIDTNTKVTPGSNTIRYFETLNINNSKRTIEADALRDSLDNYSLPTIVMGDFNDIGGSCSVRQTMGTDLEDAWWNGGVGYGHTYHSHGLYFRFDHILYSKEHFKLKGVKVLSDWNFSDHYPIVADLELKD